MNAVKTASVKMRWDTFTFPIMAGTPVSQGGVLANNSTAYGLVIQTISTKPDASVWLQVITGGIVDMEEIIGGYGSELNEDAITALSGIHFFKGGKRINTAEESPDISKVAHNLAAEYDSTSTYAVGDYCTHDGTLYKCSTAINTAEAWTAAHWTAVTVTAEMANSGGGGESDFFVVTVTTDWWTDPPSKTANCTWAELTATTKPILWNNQIAQVYNDLSGGRIAYIVPSTSLSAYEFHQLWFEATGNEVIENSFTINVDMSQVTANIAPLYSEYLTYNVGDLIIYNNTLYQCTTAVSAPEAFVFSKWTQTSIAAVIAAL